VFVTAILLVWGPAAGLVKAQEKKAVRVAGAGLLSEWLQENSDLYMKGAPACSVTISGATTGIGVQRLMEGNAELAALTRAMTAEEIKKAEAQGLSLGSKLVGYIGLAVVTNRKNSVNELTMEQLARSSREINWSQVGGRTNR
jgi:ABC-type phosphate transport system substrate-binding protein